MQILGINPLCDPADLSQRDPTVQRFFFGPRGRSGLWLAIPRIIPSITDNRTGGCGWVKIPHWENRW